MPTTSDTALIGVHVEVDGDWIVVPPSFPCQEWADARSWAADLAAQAFGDASSERAAWEQVAVALASTAPPEFVDGVLWYSPRDGGPMGVALLTISDQDPELTDAREWAMLGVAESLTPVQVTRYDSESFGEIVQSATTFLALGADNSEPGAEPVDDAPVTGRIRTVAMTPVCVLVLEAVSADLTVLARMQPEMVAVLEGIAVEVALDEDGP